MKEAQYAAPLSSFSRILIIKRVTQAPFFKGGGGAAGARGDQALRRVSLTLSPPYLAQ